MTLLAGRGGRDNRPGRVHATAARSLPRSQAHGLLLPALDGWVVDRETLILHHFSGDGQWTGERMEVRHDPALAEQYATAYEAAWEKAIYHAEYRPD
ncbi:DUF6879 family protein [Streptomyces sp. W16]|uniref:DUF6879 family protein n=1 Tax=Streptomyces sp. W16 TaxID=3076631 RepID=UPI003FA36930